MTAYGKLKANECSRTSRRDTVWEFLVDEWRAAGKDITATVSGRSMEPTLPYGTQVGIRLGVRPSIQRNDIVCIRRPGHLMLHRVLVCFGPICIEKGDGNRYPGLCLRHDIVGLFTGIIEAGISEPCRISVSGSVGRKWRK